MQLARQGPVKKMFKATHEAQRPKKKAAHFNQPCCGGVTLVVWRPSFSGLKQPLNRHRRSSFRARWGTSLTTTAWICLHEFARACRMFENNSPQITLDWRCHQNCFPPNRTSCKDIPAKGARLKSNCQISRRKCFNLTSISRKVHNSSLSIGDVCELSCGVPTNIGTTKKCLSRWFPVIPSDLLITSLEVFCQIPFRWGHGSTSPSQRGHKESLGFHLIVSNNH